MGFHKAALIISIVMLILSCSKQGEQFVGRWSNEWTNGKLLLDIQRDGDNFLMRTFDTETGRVIVTNSAKLQDGYLVLNDAYIKKLTYSESENAIVPVDSAVPLPAYRRVAEKTTATLEQPQATAETAIAKAITAYFEKIFQLRVT